MHFKKIFFIFAFAAYSFYEAAPALALFTDVSANNRYAPAINQLYAAGIISGYPDGEFKPEKLVNRAEFLKLALESSSINTEVTTTTGFTDVDEKAWYAKYIRKAYKEGWITGYGDRTFHPENPITKAEGIKMIGAIQHWQLPPLDEAGPFKDTSAGQWFTPYISYAFAHGFLEEKGEYFIPDALLTREKTSDLIFRAYATKIYKAEKYSPRFALTPLSYSPTAETSSFITTQTSIQKTSAEKTKFNPIPYTSYPADFFTGIKLSSAFPNTFYLNEVYYFEGTSTSNKDKAFVFLIPEGATDTSKYINYMAPQKNSTFKIPVYFRATGNFKLGLIPGDSGESKVVDISVLPSLPQNNATNNNPTPSDQTITYANGESSTSWRNNGNNLIKITFAQGIQTKTFIFRQDISTFTLPYAEFTGFIEGKTTATIEGAKLASESPLIPASAWGKKIMISFDATNHHFVTKDDTAITISSLPYTYTNGQTISISGTAKKEILADAAVTRPDGTVEIIKMTSPAPYGKYYSSDTITANNTFTFRYTPTTNEGTYFMEINGRDGEAVLNYPVYPQGKIPLMPDFVDLSTLGLDQPDKNTADLTTLRSQLLRLINSSRTEAGKQMVKSDALLDKLAQLQSEDMAARNYFGHINPDGQTPDDRRIAMGITTSVGENLAQAPTITYAHNGLMRSGIHRSSILNSNWTRVGLGIAKDANGYYLITEEFSSDSLTPIDLINLKNKILASINQKRTNLSLAPFTLDDNLSSIADDWSLTMAQQNFFDFVSPNGDSLTNAVRKINIDRSIQAQILEAKDIDSIINQLSQTADIALKTWNTIGIGLAVDNIGNLKTTLLYSTY